MLEFRPHHFLCTLGFEGKGYSEEFVQGYARIADSLRNTPDGDDTMIRVVGISDSICTPCPNRRGEACSTDTKIRQLDAAHSQVTGIRPGAELTWAQAKRTLAAKMTIEKFHSACAPCSWRALGVCEKALLKLKSEFQNP